MDTKRLALPIGMMFLCLVASLGLQAKEEIYPSTHTAGSKTSDFTINNDVEAIDGKKTDMLDASWVNKYNNNAVYGVVEFGIDPTTLEDQTFPFQSTIYLQIDYDFYTGSGFTSAPSENISLTINYDPDDASTAKAFYRVEGAHSIKATITQGPYVPDLDIYLLAEVHVDRAYHFNRNDKPSNLSSTIHANDNMIELSWTGISGAESNAESYELEWVHYNSYDGSGSIDNGNINNTMSAASMDLPENPFYQASRINTKELSYKLPIVFDKGYLLYRVRGKGKIKEDGYQNDFVGKWSSDGNPTTNVSAFGDYVDLNTNVHDLEKNWSYQAVFTEDGKNKYSMTYVDGSGRTRQTVVNQNDRNEAIVSEIFYDNRGRAAIEALPAPTNNNPSIEFYSAFNQNQTGDPYSNEDFEKTFAKCENPTDPFSTTTTKASAGKYYSSNNSSNAVDEDMYVPDAGGFPFSQTIYAKDNTGRVIAKTIPGEDFNLASGKQSKFIYANVFQRELDVLFASDAGLAANYKKNVTIDANGQASVSIINSSDNTVATYLVGPPPEGISGLESNIPSPTSAMVDLLGKARSTDNYGLMEDFDYVQGTREMTRVLAILANEEHEFEYTINAERYTHTCEDPNAQTLDYCYDCVLDVEVSLLNECGDEFLPGIDGGSSNTHKVFDLYTNSVDCISPLQDNYIKGTEINKWKTSDSLEAGAYNLRKTLKIDFERLDLYFEDFFTSNQCLKTEEQFKQEEITRLELTANCDYDCAECANQLGASYASSTFNIAVNANCDPCLEEAEYNQLIKECEENCKNPDPCEIAYNAMMIDMSPNGQYGKVNDNGGFNPNLSLNALSNKFEPWKFPLSIFNETNILPHRLIDDNNPGSNIIIRRPSWRNPISLTANGLVDINGGQYLDEFGDPSRIYLDEDLNGNYTLEFYGTATYDGDLDRYYIYPKNLKKIADFIDHWQPQWAEQLVPYHPEYGHYQYCNLMVGSHEFDNKMIAEDVLNDLIVNHDDIANDIIYSSQNPTFFQSVDPFFKTTGENPNPYSGDVPLLVAAMQHKLNNYATKGSTTYNIWEIAWILGNCPTFDFNCSNCPLPNFGSNPSAFTLNQNSWQQFRALYLAAKRLIMKNHRAYKMLGGVHPAGGNTVAALWPSHNECVGDQRFNKHRSDFLFTSLQYLISSNTHPNLFKRNMQNLASVFAGSNLSHYLDPGQPCNIVTYYFYKYKSPRFDENHRYSGLEELKMQACNNNAVNQYAADQCEEKSEAILDEMKKKAQASRLAECGQCPLAFDLQELLMGIIRSSSFNLGSSSILFNCNIPELTTNLNAALNTANASAPPSAASNNLLWTNIGPNPPNTLIVNVGANNCQMIFSPISHPLVDYSNVTDICCLATSEISSNPAANNYVYNLTIYYPDPLNPTQTIEEVVQLTSCIDLYSCDIGEDCEISELGSDVQDMFNSLTFFNTSGNQPNDLANTVNLIDLDPNTATNYEILLTRELKEYFVQFTASSSGNLQWNASVNGLVLSGNVEKPSPSPSCNFELTLTTAPTQGHYFDFDYFFDIKPDLSTEDKYDFIIYGVHAQDGNVYELKGTNSCIQMENCVPYTDQGFGASLDQELSENCYTTTLYDDITEELKDFDPTASNPLTLTGDYDAFDYSLVVSTCNLTFKTVDSDAGEYHISDNPGGITIDDIKDNLRITGTYIETNEFNQSRMFAVGRVCDGTLNDCLNSSILFEVIVDCGNLFNCAPNDLPKLNNKCDYYPLFAEVQSSFEQYFIDNYDDNDEIQEDASGDFLILENFISGASLKLHDGIYFDHPISNFILDEKNEELVNISGSTRTNYLLALHDMYIDPEPNVNGYLLNAYLICEIDNGLSNGKRLVSYRLETDENAPFGQCTDCYKNNLVENGDFEFGESGYISPFTSIPSSQIGSFLNYLPDPTAYSPPSPAPSGEDASIVTYENYFEHMRVQQHSSGNNVQFKSITDWSGCSQLPAYKGLFSSISKSATKSMTGNFLLNRLQKTANSSLWKQNITLSNPTQINKEYTFAFNAMQFFKTLDQPCSNDIEIVVRDGSNNEIKRESFVLGSENLDRIWEIAKSENATCSGWNLGAAGPLHHEDKKYSIDWENIELNFRTALNGTNAINIEILSDHTTSTCGSYEFYYVGLDNISLRETCRDISPLCKPQFIPEINIDDLITSCQEELEATAAASAQVLYDRYIDSVKQAFKEGYIRKCLNAYEKFEKVQKEAEHHYTLYYYDQAGNLVRTVPPKGVTKIDQAELADVEEDRFKKTKSVYTAHEMTTTYAYNSMGQLTKQYVPDHNDLDEISHELLSHANSGLPSGLKIKDIAFADALHGILVGTYHPASGDHGLIFYTEDGGRTWEQGKSGSTENFNFISESKHIVGSEGIIMIYDAVGGDYDQIPSPTKSNLIYLFETGTLDEYIVFNEDGSSWKTTDRGASWEQENDNLNAKTDATVNAIEIDATSNKGIAVTNTGEIFFTANEGSSWHSRKNIFDDELRTAVFTGSRYLVSGKRGGLMELEDETAADELDNLGNLLKEEVYELVAANDNRLHAITKDNNAKGLSYSTDGGKTWTAVALDINGGDPVDLLVINENIVYALTEKGFYNTNTDGLSWNNTFNNISGLTDASAAWKDGNDIVIGTSSGKYIRSADNGVTYTSQSSLVGNSNEVKEMVIDMVNKEGLVLVGDDLYHSDNNGTNGFANWTWTLVPNYTNDDFVDIHFNSNTEGFALTSKGKIISTTDGGKNWAEQIDFNDSDTPYLSFWIESTGEGLLVGEGGIIQKTTDKGLNWSDLSSNIQLLALNGVSIDKTNNNYYIVGDKGSMLKSSNGGYRWELKNTLSDKRLLDIDVDNNIGVFAGESIAGEIAIGKTERVVSMSDDIYEVHYNPSSTTNKVYMVKETGIIYDNNTTGSFTTNYIIDNEESFFALSVDAVTEDIAIVGDRGVLYEGNVGLSNWTKINEYNPPQLYGAFALNKDVFYAGGEFMYLSISRDGGKSWEKFDDELEDGGGNSYPESIKSIYFSDEETGIVIGFKNGYNSRGFTFDYDENASTSWSPLYITNLSSQSVVMPTSKRVDNMSFLNDQIGMIIGMNAIYVTEDGILGTWKEIDDTPVSSSNPLCAFFVDEDLAYAAGNGGSFLKIERNGSGNFVASYIGLVFKGWGPAYRVRSLYFVDHLRGYAVGDNGTLHRTINGGVSWEEIDVPGTDNLFDIHFTQLGEAMFGGVAGTFGYLSDYAKYFSDRFYYDKLGRLVASQNANQYDDPRGDVYSYTIYDALGRITEVGEIDAIGHIDGNYSKGLLDQNAFEAWIANGSKSQMTKTFYDAVMESCSLNIQQENLRSRVASTTYRASGFGDDCIYDHATHYSYDVHGNVKTVYQEFPELEDLEQNFKRIDYEYDLVSGNVIQVNYQTGENDQFFHKYEYDGDNRLNKVYTSTNGWNWEEDASYEYYRHGPLKRTELGAWDVQGMDYAYTVQGWLKGVNSNSLNSKRDIGRDGIASANNHNKVAVDAYGFNLGYYDGDYTPVGAPTEHFEADISGSYIANNMKNLYNGNISYMTTAFNSDAVTAAGPQAMIYEYDQLNRIKGATSYTRQFDVTNKWSSENPLDDRYNTTYSYDANGNITALTRKDAAGSLMDDFQYTYHHTESQAKSGNSLIGEWGGKNTNRLMAVEDQVNNGTEGADLKSGQNLDDMYLENNNYEYDEIGNLIKDEQEDIDEIEWTVAGKVKKIKRVVDPATTAPDLEFHYDALGNRIRKIVKPRETDGSVVDEDLWEETYYIRDAQGNVLTTYTKNYGEGTDANATNDYIEYLRQSEIHLYGSERLGMYTREVQIAEAEYNADILSGRLSNKNNVQALQTAQSDHLAEYKGKKQYELKNHLGNVLATIKDVKYPVHNTNSISTLLTETYGGSDWNAVAGGSLSPGNGELEVTASSINDGAQRGISVSSQSGCTYQYCFTISGMPNDGVYFETYAPGGALVSSTLVLSSSNCLPVDVDLVSDIAFVLKDLGSGNSFTLTSGKLESSCSINGFAFYAPVVTSRQDYYPFGMPMGGDRSLSSGESYRFGFNGMEKDNEINGYGNSVDFGARVYESRLGRWFSMDDYIKKTPFLSPYVFSNNSPIKFYDPDGNFPNAAAVAKFIVTVLNVAPEREAERRINQIRDKMNGDPVSTSTHFMSIRGENVELAGTSFKDKIGGNQIHGKGEMTANGVTFEGEFFYHKKDTKAKSAVTNVNFDDGISGKGTSAGAIGGASGFLIEFSNSKNVVLSLVLNKEDFRAIKSAFYKKTDQKFQTMLNKEPKLKDYYNLDEMYNDVVGYFRKHIGNAPNGKVDPKKQNIYNQKLKKYNETRKEYVKKWEND